MYSLSGLCAGIYSVLCFKWRDTKEPSHFGVNWSGQWKELISALYFFNTPPSTLSLFPLLMPINPPTSFPTWRKQRRVSIGYPFTLRLPGLPQSFFFSPPVSDSPPVWLSFFVSPHLSVHISFPSPFICLYPSLDLHSCVQLQLFCHHWEESWHPTVYKPLLKAPWEKPRVTASPDMEQILQLLKHISQFSYIPIGNFTYSFSFILLMES